MTLFDLSEDSENYERAENSHKIVYRTGLPEKDIIEYVKDGQKTKAPEVERSGYVLTDWMNGKTPFDFNIVIEADYTLTAAWGYEEAADSGAFFGFYYDSASDIIIELKKDNAAVYDGENCEYYILSSHEIIFEKADGVMSGTAYFSRRGLYSFAGLLRDFLRRRRDTGSHPSGAADGNGVLCIDEIRYTENSPFVHWTDSDIADGILADFNEENYAGNVAGNCENAEVTNGGRKSYRPMVRENSLM